MILVIDRTENRQEVALANISAGRSLKEVIEGPLRVARQIRQIRARSKKGANRRTRCSPKGEAHARNNGKRRRQTRHKVRSREARRKNLIKSDIGSATAPSLYTRTRCNP
jgi:hypothetical protein